MHNNIIKVNYQLLTNISTTLLQLINHIKSSQQPINKDYIFVKHLNNINHLANNLNKIHTDNLQTANKMLINHLQEIYSLRYDQYHKQTIKLLLQMVNIIEVEN